MKVRLILIGKTSDSYFQEAEKVFEQRLLHYCSFERIDLPNVKTGKKPDIERLRKEEGDLILSKIQVSDFLILLDDKGKERSSEEFADWIEKLGVQGRSSITFVVGGAYGFSEEVYKRADTKFSLSRMTFSHQMVRTIFLEQLYRAFTILKNERYHH